MRRTLLITIALLLCIPASASAASSSSVRYNWTVIGSKTRAVQLLVHRITPANATVEVACDGRGCPFKTRKFKPRNGRVVLTKFFRKLRANAHLAIVTAAPGDTGRIVAFTTRRGKIPVVASACAVFGSTSPVGCPGTQGPPGAQGPAGQRGTDGARGIPGINGTNGTNGADATTLWAVLNSNGSLGRGSRVTSTAKLATGIYEVVFDRDVTGCAFVGSLGDAGFGTVFGFFSATKRASQPNGLFITTANTAGTFTDEPFHVAVFC